MQPTTISTILLSYSSNKEISQWISHDWNTDRNLLVADTLKQMGLTMRLKDSKWYSSAFKFPINKMLLCSLSIVYACLYHNPTITMGPSVHNVDISKPLAPRCQTHGLQLRGRLDILPNSLKRCWRWLMVEKLTFNSLATALVDSPGVCMPNARSSKHLWHYVV